MAEDPPPLTLEVGDGFVGFPVVAYLPEAGLLGGGYGVYYFDTDRPDPKTSSVQALVLAATGGLLAFEVAPEVFLAQRAYWLRAELGGRIDPDASFFGLGNETRQGDEESYEQKVLELELEGRRELVSQLYAGAALGVGYRSVEEVEPGGLLDTLAPEGREGGWVSGLGPSLTWDSRDRVFAPSSGLLVTAQARLHAPWLGSEFSFTRLSLDARQFVDLGDTHVLALQAIGEASLGSPPFDRNAKLGGAELLRGYLRGRFRDDALVAAQVEWRFPIYWRFRGAVFLATGQVVGESAFSVSSFHVAGGLGIRFVLSQSKHVHVRLDAAASPDTVRPYFAPGEAFQ